VIKYVNDIKRIWLLISKAR